MQHKLLLEELIRDHMGIGIHSIKFVPRSDIYLNPMEKLKSVNLGHLTPIYFNVSGDYYSQKPSKDNMSNIVGATVCTIQNNDKEPVIFLPNDTPIETSSDDELTEEIKSVLLFLALVHELAHVKDMHAEINFKFNPASINLVESEAYAHSFTMDYCNKIGAKIARDTYAEGIYRINSSKKNFDQKLYRSICKKIGKGRFKKWAKA